MRGVGEAAAAWLAVGVVAHGEGAVQGGAGRGGELGGDLVQGRSLGWACLHATHRLRSAASRAVHSIVLWNNASRRRDGRGGGRGGCLRRRLAAALGERRGRAASPGRAGTR